MCVAALYTRAGSLHAGDDRIGALPIAVIDPHEPGNRHSPPRDRDGFSLFNEPQKLGQARFCFNG